MQKICNWFSGMQDAYMEADKILKSRNSMNTEKRSLRQNFERENTDAVWGF